MSHPTPTDPDSGVDFIAFQKKPEFQRLRSKQRRFVFPLAVFFLLWYLAYVLVAAYAPAFMATPVFGNINIGIIAGLFQFVTTFAITMWYVRFANRSLDPDSTELRAELERLEGTHDHPAHDPMHDRTATATGSAAGAETEGDRA